MSRNDFPLRRRSILAGSAAALASATGFMSSVTADDGTTATDEGVVAPLEFFSPVSLLNADEEPLTDEELVAVWAEPTARNELPEFNGKTRGPAVPYTEDAKIPLVAVDDRNNGMVAGAGALLAIDGTNWPQGNEEFLLNLLD